MFRIAVLIKQVPKFEAMDLTPDGRLRRNGLELEMNPYCRRAVSKGVELAEQLDGRCDVFTLGPPPAAEVLREAVAWGADRGFLVTDPAFAGSDTLATSRALARALHREGPFDLVLAGRNSVDADTGQVGPEVAELLGLPFLAGVRELELDGRRVSAQLECDDGWLTAETSLPAVLSCAERLCEPAKAKPEEWTSERIVLLTADDLGAGPWGQAGSPTSVGEVRILEAERLQLILSGNVGQQVVEAVAFLEDSGALSIEHGGSETGSGRSVPDAVAPSLAAGHPVVAVIVEPGQQGLARELIGAAAVVASQMGASVTALGAADALPARELAASWGADRLVVLRGSAVEEDVARVVDEWCGRQTIGATLLGGTIWGREVAARLAARQGAGLTGDAVDLTVDGGQIVGWKPAFGGRLVAAVRSSSPNQIVTVRPGMLELRNPRPTVALAVEELDVGAAGRVRHLERVRDDDVAVLARAMRVVGVGTGVQPSEYALLEPLCAALGAEMAATRKVTDQGWLPRSRQVGITGRSINPRLYVAIGTAGKFNHMVGVRGAGQVLAINADATAPVFAAADVGICADWHEAVPLLTAALQDIDR